MRPIWKTASVLGLLGLGYVLGASGTFASKPLGAQGAPAEGGPSEDSRKKLQDAFTAIKSAAETLEQENLYVPATTTLNVFSVTSMTSVADSSRQTRRTTSVAPAARVQRMTESFFIAPAATV